MPNGLDCLSLHSGRRPDFRLTTRAVEVSRPSPCQWSQLRAFLSAEWHAIFRVSVGRQGKRPELQQSERRNDPHTCGEPGSRTRRELHLQKRSTKAAARWYKRQRSLCELGGQHDVGGLLWLLPLAGPRLPWSTDTVSTSWLPLPRERTCPTWRQHLHSNWWTYVFYRRT